MSVDPTPSDGSRPTKPDPTAPKWELVDDDSVDDGTPIDWGHDPVAGGPGEPTTVALSPPPPGEPPSGPPHGPPPGDGRFVLLSVIAQGGQGCVLRAYDRLLRRQVALKTFHRLAQNEAELLASFRDPGIIRVFDLWPAGDPRYIVMEYADRGNLGAYLGHDDFEEKLVVQWAIDLCEALQRMHDRTPEPLAHSDIKPGNILLLTPSAQSEGVETPTRNWIPVLGDFGLVCSPGSRVPRGTRGFEAPEQRDPDLAKWTDDLGRRAAAIDQYGLAATLYWMLALDDKQRAARGGERSGM